MVRQYLQLGSRTLAYLDNDPGATGKPVLVLVHAFPLGAQMWEPQFRGAFHGWRILAPDLRGFGGSTDPRADDVEPTLDDYAEDIAALVREVAGGPVVLGGLSLGGYVAFAVMRRTPALVRALILADTRASADSLEGRAGRKAMLNVLEHDGPQGVAREMMPKLLGATTREHNPDVEETVRLLIKRQSPSAIRDAIVRMMERPDATPLLAGIAVPALVIVGDEDELTPPADAEAIAAGLPNASLARISGAGHLANLEQGMAFEASIEDFLAGLPTA
ncbi:MAG TPA: alpha/beta fold hydrolase [Vicinamibacterales bacterium]|nr:alpha/beta fold hydrolase [Vicinamibacterales bacterium]